jgi:hypothetical protein
MEIYLIAEFIGQLNFWNSEIGVKNGQARMFDNN